MIIIIIIVVVMTGVVLEVIQYCWNGGKECINDSDQDTSSKTFALRTKEEMGG
jgi:hypothetical protein